MGKFNPILVLVCSQSVSSEAVSLFRRKVIRQVEGLCLVKKSPRAGVSRHEEVWAVVQLCH